MGIRLTADLRGRLEELAQEEGLSLSDIVRRAVQIYLSGDAQTWETQQLRKLERSRQSSQTHAPNPEVQRCGEWLRSLPEENRHFVMKVGQALEDCSGVKQIHTRWYEFLKVSPSMMWYAEARPPIRVDLPEDEQLLAMARNLRIVECNDSFARTNGYSDASELCCLRLVEAYKTNDDGLQGMARAFIRSGYQLYDHLLTIEDARGDVRRSIASMVGHVEGGLLLDVWGAAQGLDRFDGTLRAKAPEDAR